MDWSKVVSETCGESRLLMDGRGGYAIRSFFPPRLGAPHAHTHTHRHRQNRRRTHPVASRSCLGFHARTNTSLLCSRITATCDSGNGGGGAASSLSGVVACVRGGSVGRSIGGGEGSVGTYMT